MVNFFRLNSIPYLNLIFQDLIFLNLFKSFLRGLLLFVVVFTSATVFAQDKVKKKVLKQQYQGIEKYLFEVKTNASAIKVAELDFESARLLNEIDLSEYDWSSFLSLSQLNAKDPQRNPFSPTKNEVNTLGFGVVKKWKYGFETTFNYNVTDNSIVFPGNNLDYYFPDVSVQVKSNLIDDLIYQQGVNKVLKIKNINKSLVFDKQVKIRQALVESLLDLVNVIEIKNQIKLEDQICDEIEKQNKKLARKRSLGSISRRDYLTSQKEVNNCQINIKSLKNQKLSLIKALETKYSIPRTTYSDFEIESLFGQVKSLYRVYSAQKQGLSFDSTLELQNLKQKIDVLKLEHKQLAASAKPDLSFEARYGLRGLNQNFSDAQQDITDTNFQNYYVGLRMDLPFKNRRAQSLLASNEYKTDIASTNYSQFLKQKETQFFVLKETLDENLYIYDKLEENHNLSRQILSEGLKDFNNGRLDFYNLTELRKAYLASQSQIIQLRSQILINIVEFIDYFNYFERYY